VLFTLISRIDLGVVIVVIACDYFVSGYYVFSFAPHIEVLLV